MRNPLKSILIICSLVSLLSLKGHCKDNYFLVGFDETFFLKSNFSGSYQNKTQSAFGGGVFYNFKEKNRISILGDFMHIDTGVLAADPNSPGPNNQPSGIYSFRYQYWYFFLSFTYQYQIYKYKKFSIYGGLGYTFNDQYKYSYYKKTSTYEMDYLLNLTEEENYLKIFTSINYHPLKFLEVSLSPFFLKNLTLFNYDRTGYGISLQVLINPFRN
jgi:hypothetical protein